MNDADRMRSPDPPARSHSASRGLPPGERSGPSCPSGRSHHHERHRDDHHHLPGTGNPAGHGRRHVSADRRRSVLESRLLVGEHPRARWWLPSMPPGGRSLRPPLPALAAARAQGGRPASAAPRHRYRSNRPRSPMVPTERYAADQHRDASTRSGAPGAGRQRPWGHGHPLRTGSAVGRADRSKSRSGTDLTEFAGTNAPVGGAGHATPRLLVVGGRPRSR
jgi:hypothetical protein